MLHTQKCPFWVGDVKDRRGSLLICFGLVINSPPSGRKYVLLSQWFLKINLGHFPHLCLLVSFNFGDCFQRKFCSLAFVAAKKYIAVNWKDPPPQHCLIGGQSCQAMSHSTTCMTKWEERWTPFVNFVENNPLIYCMSVTLPTINNILRTGKPLMLK